jgi:hypothetical protein
MATPLPLYYGARDPCIPSTRCGVSAALLLQSPSNSGSPCIIPPSDAKLGPFHLATVPPLPARALSHPPDVDLGGSNPFFSAVEIIGDFVDFFYFIFAAQIDLATIMD